jgi:hypothetical protein
VGGFPWPRSRWRGGVYLGAEQLVGAEGARGHRELVVLTEVPVLQGEGETLFVEQFVVELVQGWGGREHEAEAVGALVLVGFVAFFRFDENNVFDGEEEERDTLEVVGERRREDGAEAVVGHGTVGNDVIDGVEDLH